MRVPTVGPESEGGRVCEERGRERRREGVGGERQRVKEGGCGRRETESEGERVWEERGRE